MGLYRRFLGYVRPYRALGIAASLSFVLSGFLGAYPTSVNVGRAFVWLAVQYIGLRLALGGVQLAESYLSRKLTQSVVFDLRSDLYAHLQSLSIGFYETWDAGDIISRALGDVGALAGGVMGPLTRLAGELAQLGWARAFLYRYQPEVDTARIGHRTASRVRSLQVWRQDALPIVADVTGTISAVVLRDTEHRRDTRDQDIRP